MQVANPIIVVPYREGWVQEFEAIASDLRETLGDLALRIDHIGSTLVPGLAAKDVIDVQVTVRDFTGELDGAFSLAGYPMSLHRADHLPPTYTGPESDWEKRLYNNPLPAARSQSTPDPRL
jgi:GrpB-like predicted nucleotidyltransferase (UPF0157 family)